MKQQMKILILGFGIAFLLVSKAQANVSVSIRPDYQNQKIHKTYRYDPRMKYTYSRKANRCIYSPMGVCTLTPSSKSNSIYPNTLWKKKTDQRRGIRPWL